MKFLKKIFGKALKRITIFVVEDSPIFRDMLSHFVKEVETNGAGSKAGFKVYSFSSGEECVKALDKKKPDILVLDYQLKDHKNSKAMDGLQTFKAIKKVIPNVEGVIVTAKGNFSVNTEAINSGAAEYIEKGPGIREKLHNTINALIDKITGSGAQPAFS